MGTNYSVLYITVSIIIVLILPLAAAVFFKRLYNISWKAVIVGAAVFLFFQPLTRFPLLKYVQGTYWYTYNSVANPWIIYIFLGLTAGIFEEVGRFIGFKFFLKNKLKWKNGIAFGIGHGGIEAIILVGIPFLAMLITGSSMPAGTPPYMFLVAGAERLSAMTFHIAASLIVLYAVKQKKSIYLLYAILIHALMDASIGFLKGIALIEITAAVLAIATLIFIVMKIKASSTEKILQKD